MPTLEEADAILAQWRDRLAAASRNISELSELPAYAAARRLGTGSGRLAAEVRQLTATMDELWQGVLLIGAALDRAERARQGSWLRRADEAAAEALAILTGLSITVDLAETPVLHRRLLAGPRATAVVTPETLLRTMETAFDRAREQLTRITEATATTGRLRTELNGMLGQVPPVFRDRLAAADQTDPLDTLDALNALVPIFAEAVRLNEALRSAGQELPSLQDTAAYQELSQWLARLEVTFKAGRVEGCRVGLVNWQALRDRVAGSLERREELAARYRAYRAKQRARRPDAPGLDALADAVKAALAAAPIDTEAAERALAAYEAALARETPV